MAQLQVQNVTGIQQPPPLSRTADSGLRRRLSHRLARRGVVPSWSEDPKSLSMLTFLGAPMIERKRIASPFRNFSLILKLVLLLENRHLLDHHRQSPIPEQVMSIDWPKAFNIIKNSGFDGWMAFETPHTSVETFISEITKNVEFVMKCMS